MAQTLVPISLPIRLQCLCAPMLWRVGIDGSEPFFIPEKNKQEMPHSYDPWPMRDRLFCLKEDDNESAAELLTTAGFFDQPQLAMRMGINLAAFEAAFTERSKTAKRAELVWQVENFFSEQYRLFRQSDFVVGLDGSHQVWPQSALGFPSRLFWEFRRSAMEEMKPQVSAVFAQRDYVARFAGVVRLGPSAVITALTFKEAVAATIRIDQLRKAKFKKCQRRDCGIPFAAVGRKKRKFHSWYCGHLTSVRKKRGTK